MSEARRSGKENLLVGLRRGSERQKLEFSSQGWGRVWLSSSRSADKVAVKRGRGRGEERDALTGDSGSGESPPARRGSLLSPLEPTGRLRRFRSSPTEGASECSTNDGEDFC